jgi:cytoskeleton protein RodZ
MPDIGATLREARMRQRIDISDIEAQTKIRAKYLRALENEEFDLLPGPTFVKSFLRTYAEALGLEPRALLEEYRMRYEGPSEAELMPITPQTVRQREKAARRSGKPSGRRDVLVAAFVVAIVALLILLGRGGEDSKPPSPRTTATGAANATPTTTNKRTETTTKATPSRMRLRLNPTGPVYVCLKAGDKVLIDKQTLTPATTKRTYRAKSFRILLGNGSLTMTINGRTRSVKRSPDPIAFAITAKGRRTIPADASSICS